MIIEKTLHSKNLNIKSHFNSMYFTSMIDSGQVQFHKLFIHTNIVNFHSVGIFKNIKYNLWILQLFFFYMNQFNQFPIITQAPLEMTGIRSKKKNYWR